MSQNSDLLKVNFKGPQQHGEAANAFRTSKTVSSASTCAHKDTGRQRSFLNCLRLRLVASRSSRQFLSHLQSRQHVSALLNLLHRPPQVSAVASRGLPEAASLPPVHQLLKMLQIWKKQLLPLAYVEAGEAEAGLRLVKQVLVPMMPPYLLPLVLRSEARNQPLEAAEGLRVRVFEME